MPWCTGGLSPVGIAPEYLSPHPRDPWQRILQVRREPWRGPPAGLNPSTLQTGLTEDENDVQMKTCEHFRASGLQQKINESNVC